jgi:predicted RNA-binding protein with PIN domain
MKSTVLATLALMTCLSVNSLANRLPNTIQCEGRVDSRVRILGKRATVTFTKKGTDANTYVMEYVYADSQNGAGSTEVKLGTSPIEQGLIVSVDATPTYSAIELSQRKGKCKVNSVRFSRTFRGDITQWSESRTNN